MKITVESKTEALIVNAILTELKFSDIDLDVIEPEESLDEDTQPLDPNLDNDYWGDEKPDRKKIENVFEKFLKAPIYIGDKPFQTT